MNMLNLDISAVRSESLARLNQLRISYVVQLQRRLATFWTWWLGELVPLLPADLRAAMAKRDQRDFVSLEADTLVVRRGTISDSRTLFRIPLKAPRSSNPNLPGDRNLRMLLLDAEDVLTRTFTLPLAAEENLREVLSFEIPRKTPFSADQVYYDFVVGSRDAKTRTLVVELVLAPRRVIDRSLEELVGLAIDVDSVSVLRADGLRAMPVNLLPRKQRTRVADSIVNRLQAAMAVIALLLLVTAVAFPIVRKQQVLQSLEQTAQDAAIAGLAALRDAVAPLRVLVQHLLEPSRRLELSRDRGVVGHASFRPSGRLTTARSVPRTNPCSGLRARRSEARRPTSGPRHVTGRRSHWSPTR